MSENLSGWRGLPTRDRFRRRRAGSSWTGSSRTSAGSLAGRPRSGTRKCSRVVCCAKIACKGHEVHRASRAMSEASHDQERVRDHLLFRLLAQAATTSRSVHPAATTASQLPWRTKKVISLDRGSRRRVTARVHRGVASLYTPSGVTKPDTPVFAARAHERRVSIARETRVRLI